MSNLLSKPSSLVRLARYHRTFRMTHSEYPDIYRIVSSKSLESSTSNIEPPKASINVGPSVDSNANQGSKCC